MTIQEKNKKNTENQKKTMSLLAHHFLLQPKKKNFDIGFP
jgi:hypothetical protein